MKQLLFLVSLAGVTACAPAAPLEHRPEPNRPAAAVEPRAVEPAEALAAAPPGWWLLDETTDRVRGISAERAYESLLAGMQPKREVVVAIIDSGIDVEHEDLDDVVWVNTDELPGNRLDDDGNGYVDDVHGWNFIGGAGGENVRHDTYEAARIYAALRPRYEGARADTLSEAGREELELYHEVRDEIESQRAEARDLLQQLRIMERVSERSNEILRAHLRADSLTVEQVSAIRTTREDLQRAREVFLHMAEHDITAEAIRETRESAESRLEYGLNPEFDPRSIVGDMYGDHSERFYGNPDVEGPDADHGTHVAGIVGAERNNGLGIDGVAPAVRLMSVRAVPDGDERDKDVANAIRYAVDNGAHIINMSFGKGYSPEKHLVDAAVRHAEEHGVLIVHAAGNGAADVGMEPNFPTRTYNSGGIAQNWIEVGASSWQAGEELPAPFSNYSKTDVDVFAPGIEILSTIPGDDYAERQGTSMAAPVVTGLAAMLMAYFPELSALEVKRIILDSASRYPDEAVLRPGGKTKVPFGELSVTGGIVNAFEAVRLARERTGSTR